MEGTMAGTAAVLVGPDEAGERPATATISVPREEIEEALASGEDPELILEVQLRETERRELHVAWQRNDLATVLSGAGPGGIRFSFEPSELYRALEHPDFEGHGLREAILLTVAAASASTAFAVGTAQAGLAEGTSGGAGATAVAVSPGHAEAGTAAALAGAAVTKDEAGSTARGIGITIPGADEAGLTARGIEAPAAAVGHDEALTASALSNPAAANDELGSTARGIGITIPGADEAGLTARGIEAQPAVGHDEATLVERGIVQPAPVTVDSGSGIELPSVDAGTAALIGGLAGAGLLIVGGTFATRRRTTGTA